MPNGGGIISDPKNFGKGCGRELLIISAALLIIVAVGGFIAWLVS